MPTKNTNEPRARVPRLSRRLFLGWVIASVALVVVLAVRGPRIESYYQCPLTGQGRGVISHAGFTTSDRITTNEVSSWAEVNGISDLVAGQCGWTPISTVTAYWFSPPRFGESMAHMIPRRIHQGSFNLPGKTREETLREYQTAIITAFNAGEPLWRAQQQFVESVMR